MENFALGHLPIELTYDDTNVYIKPIYLSLENMTNPIYNYDKLYVCLEIEHPDRKYVKHRGMNKHHRFNVNSNRNDGHYNKYLYTKFYGFKYWELNSFNTVYTCPLDDIISIYSNKPSGYVFHIRATYRYDYKQPLSHQDNVSLEDFHRSFNKARTNIFSNTIELQKM